MNNAYGVDSVSERYSRGLSKRIVEDIENYSKSFKNTLLQEFQKLPCNSKSYIRKLRRIKASYNKNNILNFNHYMNEDLLKKDSLYWLAQTTYYKGDQPDNNNAIGLSIYETSLKLEKNLHKIKSYGYIPKLNMTYHCLKRYYQRAEWTEREEIYKVIKKIFTFALYITEMITSFDDQILFDDNYKEKTLIIPHNKDLFLGNVKLVNIKDGLTSQNIKALYFDCRTFISSYHLKQQQKDIRDHFISLVSPCRVQNIAPNRRGITKLFDLVDSHVYKQSFDRLG